MTISEAKRIVKAVYPSAWSNIFATAASEGFAWIRAAEMVVKAIAGGPVHDR